MQAIVVMPAYNAEEYLAEAIESVLSQTWTDLQLLVLDDGSSDRTLEIAHTFAQRDKRVTVMSQPNSGTAPTLNKLIDLASSEWVFLMHADDVMRPNRIEKQLAFIKDNPDLSVVSALVRHIDRNGRVIGQDNSQLTSAEAVQSLVQANELIGFNHPSVALKKAAVLTVGGYRQEFWPAEDIDLWNRLVEHGYKVLVQPEFLLDYRMHGASASISKATLTRKKIHWLKDSMQRRRRGESELTWNEFLNEYNSVSLAKRLNRLRKDLAKIYYKSAVADFSDKRYLSLLLHLSAAVLLQPRPVIFNTVTKLKLSSKDK